MINEQVIKNNIENIIYKLDCTPLVCAIGGSNSFGLANKTSDVDIYAIVDGINRDEKVFVESICVGGLQADFICVDFSFCKNKCDENIEKNHVYPSCMHRGQYEKRIISLQKDIQREEFPREVIGRIFASDVIVETRRGEAERCYHDLCNGLRIADIWESYYNRAYGNYYEHICCRESVLLRKYLYTISELLICRYLMDYEDIVLDFTQLINTYVSKKTRVYDCVMDLFERNKEAQYKSKELVCRNKTIDEWIDKRIQMCYKSFVPSFSLIPIHSVI